MIEHHIRKERQAACMQAVLFICLTATALALGSCIATLYWVYHLPTGPP